MSNPTEPAPPRAAADPLDMARIAAANVGTIAEIQDSPDSMVRLQAAALGLGREGYTTAIVGGCLALISLAGDVRRIADHLTGGES